MSELIELINTYTEGDLFSLAMIMEGLEKLQRKNPWKLSALNDFFLT